MKKLNPTWGERDFAAATDAKNDEADSLEALLRDAGKNVPQRPALTASAVDNFDRMTAHVAQLRATVKLSIANPSAPARTTGNGGAKVFDPDAALLKARGVTTYRELNALPPASAAD